jgi:hypothetical protein
MITGPAEAAAAPAIQKHAQQTNAWTALNRKNPDRFP